MTILIDDLLQRVLRGSEEHFAVLHRPEQTGPDRMEVLTGRISMPASLADIQLSANPVGGHSEALVVVPYRQLAERGFAAVDDGAPLLVMSVVEQETVSLTDALTRLPDAAVELEHERYDIDDDTYEQIVRRVVVEAIGQGEGANFVIKRSFVAEIKNYDVSSALSFFRRLLQRETGAYWTFVIHTGSRTFVGASPERHVSLHGGLAVMNPISGTYRYPATGPNLNELMVFLTDRKESDELYMVLDEELKMMARICPDGGRIVGPYLKEMAHLAHTEYFIEGHTERDAREILRESLLAPTVTGSPVESACRIIRAHESRGRAYYSGVAALIGTDATGRRRMDSTILIRTADIDSRGHINIGVGATLVRHSDPSSEAAETRAKAAGLVAALKGGTVARFATDPSVRTALARRNETVADFWLRDVGQRRRPDPDLAGVSVLVVDAEDTFTSMLASQLRAMGLVVTVCSYDQVDLAERYDLVVMGPGPGDPGDPEQPRIVRLRSTMAELLARRSPFLAICLSHQILSLALGLRLRRREHPNQGVQREVELFGARELVGFYNTFAAYTTDDRVEVAGVGPVEVSRDAGTEEVHALRGPGFASMQFHPESVLTRDGPRIVADMARHVLAVESAAVVPGRQER